MFDHILRLFKDRLFAPLARLVGPSVSPNFLSVLAFLFGAVCAVAAYAGQSGLALLCWGLNRTLDGLDGTHARVHGRQTDFGGYLDIVLDFTVYAAVPVALVMADVGALAVPGAFLLASFFVNAASLMYLAAILERRQAGAAAQGELTTVTMPPGIVAGAETVVLFALFLALPSYRAPLFWTMGALVFANVVQRLVWAARRL